MPYKIVMNTAGEHCVHNSVTGENKGCSATHAMAVAHMRALYMAETAEKSSEVVIKMDVGLAGQAKAMLAEAGKMMTEAEALLSKADTVVAGQELLSQARQMMTAAEARLDRAGLEKCYDDYLTASMGPNYGAHSFAELDVLQAAREKQYELLDVVGDYRTLMGNVISATDIEDKAAALQALADEFSTRLSEQVDIAKAVWSTAYKNDLSDENFLYIEPGGEKDAEGKTVPRRLRHLPYKNAQGNIDLFHLRNAIARIPQMVGISAELKDRLQAKARRLLERLKKGLAANEEGDTVAKEWEVVLKAWGTDGSKHLVYGVVLKPDQADAQGDVMSPEDIEKAAHAFLINSRQMDHRHIETLPPERAVPVESWIAPVDLTIHGHPIQKGSWVMTAYVPDETVWQSIQKGQLLSYSIKGSGRRLPLP